MRRIKSNDAIFDKLISGRDEFLYNLIYLVRECENPLLFTDDATCIVAQSNTKTPLWIFLNQIPSKAIKTELQEIIREALAQNPSVKITGVHEYLHELLEETGKQTGKTCVEKTPMNVYACFQTKNIPVKGRMLNADAIYKADMAQLMKQMVWDIEKREMSEKDAKNFAGSVSDSRDLFLWKDGEIKSMAMIAHRTEKYARINTVVTKKECRGRGYGAMLVKAVSDNLLPEGLTPMLYAEADYPSSNRMYQKIGYEKQGVISEHIFI